jgi:hypothetical protein
MSNLKSRKNHTRRSRKNKSRKHRGGGCSGTVSISNAVKRTNCSWTRTANGKAQLGPKTTLTTNMNVYNQ